MTTINVTRNQNQIRLVIGEPTGEGENVNTTRHWDLPITHALMLAAGLTGEVIGLLQAEIKAQAERAPERRDTLPAPPPEHAPESHANGAAKSHRDLSPPHVGKRPANVAAPGKNTGRNR